MGELYNDQTGKSDWREFEIGAEKIPGMMKGLPEEDAALIVKSAVRKRFHKSRHTAKDLQQQPLISCNLSICYSPQMKN